MEKTHRYDYDMEVERIKNRNDLFPYFKNPAAKTKKSCNKTDRIITMACSESTEIQFPRSNF